MKKKPNMARLVILLVAAVLLIIYLSVPSVNAFVTNAAAVLGSANVDAVIGTQGIVLARIDNLQATGTVKLGGMDWTARSTSGEPIPEGTTVKVDKVEGVKVFVSPVTVKQTVS